MLQDTNQNQSGDLSERLNGGENKAPQKNQGESQFKPITGSLPHPRLVPQYRSPFSGIFSLNKNYESNVSTCLSNMGDIKVLIGPALNSLESFESFIIPRLSQSKCSDFCCLPRQNYHRNKYSSSVVDGPVVKIYAGRKFLNQFLYKNFEEEPTNIWMAITKGNIFGSQANQHFFFAPIFSISSMGNERYTIYSRYCGTSIKRTLEEFDLSEVYTNVCKTWESNSATSSEESSNTRGFFSMKFLIGEIAQVMQDRISDDGNFSLYRDLYMLINYVTSNSKYNDLDSINEMIKRFHKKLLLNTYEEQPDKEKLFVAILLLKALYVESALKKHGIIHDNLNFDNLTWELVDSSLSDDRVRNIEISDSVSFDKEKLFKNPQKYRLILRVTDLSRLTYKHL